MATNRTKKTQLFPCCKKRKVEGEFSGGSVTSDGGILLLRAADNHLGLTREVARVLEDPREPRKLQHRLEALLQQRVYGIALGYEDLNDHITLRHDPAWQTAVGEEQVLSSSSTLCRFESWSSREAAVEIHRILLKKFIKSHKYPPKELILDFDATDVLVYGNQDGKFYHGFYRHHCFLPLYVTCGDWVLVSYLRRSNIDAAKHSRAILSLLVKELRRVWPKVRIIFRADSGFCRHHLFSWCERKGVDYIVGIARNNRLEGCSEPLLDAAEEQYETSGEKQRLFSEFQYGAESWSKERRVIVKAEVNSRGRNPRFVVTTLSGDPQKLYDKLYCARGDMENRIKQQLEMFSDRTSCQRWWPNQFRILLSTIAYTLVHAIRSLGLQGTQFARAQVGTIRLKLLKIGTIVLRNTRRVRFLFSSAFPYQHEFFLVARRLAAG